MKIFKMSFFAALILMLSTSVAAQDTEKSKAEQKGQSKITGEDLLGIKSGADPRKAPQGKKAGYSRKKGRPVVFIIGDSTVKNGKDDGSNNQWGWGHFLAEFFDTTKVSIENHALGGRSSRTFQGEGLWANVLSAVQKGDFVLMQFGHNDMGPLNTGRARAVLKGNGDQDTTVIMEATGKPETIHSFGWYMRKYAKETRAKKATPIMFSHIPRNQFTTKDSTTVIRNSDGLGKWTKEAAGQEKAFFIDLNDLIATKYEKMGKDSIQLMFYGDHTHTSKAGAVLNAQTIAEGIRNLKGCKLSKALKQ